MFLCSCSNTIQALQLVYFIFNLIRNTLQQISIPTCVSHNSFCNIKMADSHSDSVNPREERLKVMRGNASFELDLNDKNNRAAVIYGIRHNLELAQSDVITHLCSDNNEGVQDATRKNLDFCRARNARLIMSGIMPSEEDLGSFDPEEEMNTTNTDSASAETCDFDSTLKRPYCIWYPDFATEEFYRSLVAKYPGLRYQVARACAATGYSTLYHELANDQCILPEVAIAEEARESYTDGGKAIYNTIMAAPTRYQVMNDYTRSVVLAASYANTAPSFLNGDSIVYRIIDEQAAVASDSNKGWYNQWRDLSHREFITETGGITLADATWREVSKLSDNEIALLYSPLPRDLPTMNKHLLIDMAAYNGDVDRYVRLVNRRTAFREINKIIRGIHWNPLFARFWAQQLDEETDLAARITNHCDRNLIRKAISARRIMCNDWSEFEENGWDPAKPKPFLIWWPHKPDYDTMLALRRSGPEMEETVMIAAFMMEDHWLLEQWLPTCTVTQGIYQAAYQTQSKYTKEIERRLKAMGIEPDIEVRESPDHVWLHQPPDRDTGSYAYASSYAELPDYLQSTTPDDYDSSRAELKAEKINLRVFTTREKILEKIAK